jgi:hypothetical protein
MIKNVPKLQFLKQQFQNLNTQLINVNKKLVRSCDPSFERDP